jgi:hypothetical protein
MFSKNSKFDDRIRDRIVDLNYDKATKPFFLGEVTNNELLYSYVNFQRKQDISYLIMQEMYRNRKYIQ